MSAIDALVRNAGEHARGFQSSGRTAAPTLRLAVVTCMDARIDPVRLLGLREGDAHVLRNAGGVVTDDVIRSLAISQHLLGTREIVLIQHTDCGMLSLADEEFKRALREAAGEEPGWEPGGFDDLDASVRRSLRILDETPFVPFRESVRGFVYDVRTGALAEVD